MPLVNLSCPCGHRWEAIRSFSVKDDHAESCPNCGRADVSTEFSIAGRFNHGYDYEGAHPLEKAECADQNKYIAEHAEEVLSGAMAIREPANMPKHLRPQVPEHLRKTYY